MENGTLIVLETLISLLLFTVGYLLGERKGIGSVKPNDAAPDRQPPIEPAVKYPIPRAPRTTRPNSQPDRSSGVRVVSPREAIFNEMRRRDGIVDEPPPEMIPPAVANEFLNEAALTQKEKDK